MRKEARRQCGATEITQALKPKCLSLNPSSVQDTGLKGCHFRNLLAPQLPHLQNGRPRLAASSGCSLDYRLMHIKAPLQGLGLVQREFTDPHSQRDPCHFQLYAFQSLLPSTGDC